MKWVRAALLVLLITNGFAQVWAGPAKRPGQEIFHPVSPSGAMPSGVQANVTVVDATGVPVLNPPGAMPNPGSTPPGPAPDSRPISLGEAGAFAKVNKVLVRPEVQAYIRLFNNPNFLNGIEQLGKSGDWMTLLGAEVALFLLVLWLRHWRLSKTTLWYRRLWSKIWTRLFFWVAAVVAVPWAVFGSPYFLILRGGFEVILATIKK